MAKRKRKTATKSRRVAAPSKSAGTTAIVVAPSRAPAKRRPQVVRVPAGRAPARRRARSSSETFVGALKRQVKPIIGSAAYGYLTGAKTVGALAVRAKYVDKIPTLASIGAPASHGLIATFLATRTSGIFRDVFDAIGTAALHRAAYEFGESDFSLKPKASTEGVSGYMGAEDVDDIGADEDDVALRGDWDQERE